MTLTLDLRSFRLPLRTPLATAHGGRTAVEGLLLRVRDGEGRVGLGEVTPCPGFGTESLPEAAEALGAVRMARAPASLEDIGQATVQLGARPAARAGVELALLDLLARTRGVPLCRLLGAPGAGPVGVNALLGATSAAELAEQGRAAVDAGFRTLKVKVGTLPAEEDAARLAALRSAVGAQVRLRVDANAGWSEPEARRRLAQLARSGLEYAEQPVAAPDVAALRRLRAVAPVAADEALGRPGGAEAVLDGELGPAADVLILKLPVLGGILPALRLAGRARARGLEVVLTSALDGAVLRAAGAHLALALGNGKDHGLATGVLLVEDPGAYRLSDGLLHVPDLPGLGIAPEVLGW